MYDTTSADTATAAAGTSTGLLLFQLAIAALAIAGLWKMFRKAGYPGWASIVPIYNLYIICKMAGRSGWWVLLLLIPIVNIAASLLVALDLAKAFGRSAAFGVLALWLFSLIGILILGFGKSTYQGPEAVPTKTDSKSPAAV